MTRRPFVITISTPPHMRLYNECLLNSKRLVFKDAPEGLIESLLLSPEEAEKDFLTGDVKQLHITHPGDNVVPIELYREHVKKSQLRMLPEFVSEKEVGDKISRKIALTAKALDLAGVTDPRDRIPRLSGLVGGLFAGWAEGTIRKGKNREKIPEALNVLRKAQRLETKAIGADRTRQDVAAAWFWDFIMSHPLHNWVIPEERSALLKLLARETAKYAA